MKAQAEKRKHELSNRVSSIPIGDQIQIRSTTGIYRVSVLGHRPELAAVEIAFGDGTRALCKHGAIVWPEEAAKLQAEQARTQAVASGQPRQHPMQRSRSGQGLSGSLPVTQAAHPYAQPMQQGQQQYQRPPQQSQQPLQPQYYAQTQYSPPHQFTNPAHQLGQFPMPHPQNQYQQQYLPNQQAQHAGSPYQGAAQVPQQAYTHHVPPTYHHQAQQQQASARLPQPPASAPHGFVPQPIPYYNGKAVEVKAAARFPSAGNA